MRLAKNRKALTSGARRGKRREHKLVERQAMRVDLQPIFKGFADDFRLIRGLLQ
jgi:hypothetical protein